MIRIVVLSAVVLLAGVSALFAQQDPDDPGMQDSLIFWCQPDHVDSSSSYQFRFVQIIAVTDDSVTSLSLPLAWHAPLGGVVCGPGTMYFWPLLGWTHYDTVITSQNYVRTSAYCFWSPPECEPIYTNGQRQNIMSYRFIITPNSRSQLVVLDSCWDDRIGSIMFGLVDSSGFVPAIQRGFLSIGTVGINDNRSIPDAFALSQNYPNPFNASTTIEFSLPARADVEIEVYDIIGRSVRTLATGRLEAGTHLVTWDGADYSGIDTPSGVYFYALRAGKQVVTRKMIMIR